MVIVISRNSNYFLNDSLPFFILRFVYGNNAWLWEMEDVTAKAITIHYIIAFIWMGNVVMAKLYR